MRAAELVKRIRILSAGAAALAVAILVPTQSFAVADPLPGAAAKAAGFTIQVPWADGVTHVVTQGYGSGLHRGTNRECCSNDHYALDVDMKLGEDIYPIARGTILYAGAAAGSWATFGNIVFVDHGNGYQSLYAHMNSVAAVTGQAVDDNTVLGATGGTGGFRAHLHFAMYKGARFYNTALGTGQYGGQAAVPEPFSNCVKASGATCENLRTHDRLTKTSAAAPSAAPAAPGGPALPGNLTAPIRSLVSGATSLAWTPDPGSIQFRLQVIPLHNDGPAVDMIIDDPAQVASGSVTIEAPVLGQGNYVLLPGATYTWRVRQASAAGLGPWSETQSFSRPAPSAGTLTVQTPGPSYLKTPTIRWSDSDATNFYYEVQVSRDPQFRTGPDSVAPVYWNLVHGGTTAPLNSWTVPAGAALAPGIYHTRVRQRVQATPAGVAEQGIAWTAAVSFEVLG